MTSGTASVAMPVAAGVPTGLTSAEVSERRARGQSNVDPGDGGRSLARILRANVVTFFNAIVGASFLLLVALGAWQDALFGLFVIANTSIGVAQEFRSKRALARFAVLNAPRAVVRRDGTDLECAVQDVVLDDFLVLHPGGQIVADAVLVEGRELEVDESLLSGEADPVTAEVGRELLSGSTIVAGGGLARVLRVGADAYSARITAEARQFSLVRSELRDSVARIIRWISIGLLPVGAIIVNGQMQAAGGWAVAIESGAWRQAAVAATGSLMAMVPQGLVFMTSLALTVGAVKLARQRVLVHELAAVEGLARVDMLCVDKTGTLTDGTLTLDSLHPVEPAAPGWRAALAWFALAPEANATARALRAAVGRFDIVDDPPDVTVPFSSRYKWSAAHFPDGRRTGSWVLGGADVILTGTDPSVVEFRARTAALAARGHRTLVLAHSPGAVASADPGGLPSLPDGLRPAALVVLRERVRGDAATTMGFFADQGVQVCILSGDDPLTVGAVAREVGLPMHLVGIDARTLPSDPARLAEILRTERVFGRVTPQQKKAMVLALQSLGHTVAMTGDGVNDTLALKHADLGIAMGSGSAAARAVAQIVLLDGAFARLPGIVAEGRRVIGNVERLAHLFLSKTVYAILLGVTFGAMLWPFPFLPRQLSIVDGITIGLPGLVLALLPNARISEAGFLRRVAGFCIPAGLVVAIAVFGVVAYAHLGVGVPAAQVQTIAVLTLTLSALWVLVILARPFTRITTAVVVAAYASLAVVLSLPPARDFLRLELPPPELILVAVASSAVASVVLELLHHRRVRRPRARTSRMLG